jgi:hypothetical protein
VAVPGWHAIPAYAVLKLGATLTSAGDGIRSNRGINGVTDFVGTIYGLSWPILGGTVAAIGYALVRAGISDDAAAIYYTSAYALLVAAMNLAGTLVWHTADQLVIALVMAVAAAVTGFFGAPANMLAMALIAGPALLVGGVIAVVRLRRM